MREQPRGSISPPARVQPAPCGLQHGRESNPLRSDSSRLSGGLTELEQARRHRENPLWPYSWRVVYRDGTTLAQEDLSGYHYAREIDPARVVRLDVLGHPVSPITLHPPRPDPPDEIVLRAKVQLALPHDRPGWTRVDRLFGFRYGSVGYLLRIDDAGHVDAGVVGPVMPGAR